MKICLNSSKIMRKDISYYNKESVQYSSKRYPEKTRTYVQFFFKRRLARMLKKLKPYIEHTTEVKVLEIGCADGVILRALDTNFKKYISTMVGVDTSPEMIEVATKTNGGISSFYVRGSEPTTISDLILEIGVINYADAPTDMTYVHSRLSEKGTYILSVAGHDSLNARFGQGKGYNNFLSYKEYEALIQKYFLIDAVVPVGLYIPLMWRIPFIALPLQYVCECLFMPFLPNLFHEKIYFLKKKLDTHP